MPQERARSSSLRAQNLSLAMDAARAKRKADEDLAARDKEIADLKAQLAAKVAAPEAPPPA